MQQASPVRELKVPAEKWKQSKAYPGVIEVSNKGRIRQYGSTGHRSHMPEKPIYLTQHSKYNEHTPTVSFTYTDENGETRTANRIKVRELVANAFLDPKPNKYATVEHINGDIKDCESENLMWAEPKRYIQADFEIEELKTELKQLKKKYTTLLKKHLDLQTNGALTPITTDQLTPLLFNPERYDQLKYTDKEPSVVYDFPQEPEKRAKLAQTKDRYDWYVLNTTSDTDVPVVSPKPDQASDRLIIRLGDFPAYLKCKRYHDEYNNVQADETYGFSTNLYENGAKPRESTAVRIEESLNITLLRDQKTTKIDITGAGFAQRINQRLTELNMTTYALAKKTHIIHSVILDYTKRCALPYKTSDKAKRIASALNVSLCWLLTGTDDWVF